MLGKQKTLSERASSSGFGGSSGGSGGGLSGARGTHQVDQQRALPLHACAGLRGGGIIIRQHAFFRFEDLIVQAQSSSAAGPTA